jgi:dTDP-4-dehydrorhamnose reductase
MNILVIGSSGQLGWELQRSLLPLGNVIPVDFPEIDLSSVSSIQDWVKTTKPDVIINAAAYTAVDQAEEERDLAWAINSTAPGVLAQEALSAQAILIHYSTNFVFDGSKGGSYQESDPPNPINFYGESKLGGEREICRVGGEYLILRTSWLYSTRRDCFVTKVLQWARQHEVLRIVEDQTGSPTWSRTLADTTAQALWKMNNSTQSWREDKSGIYHLAGNGSVNRFEWTKRILELDPRKEEHLMKELLKAKSEEFKTLARRPKNSSLDCSLFQAAFNSFYADWESALAAALAI